MQVRALRERAPHMDIQVDGGLDAHTVNFASQAGANVIVAGTSVFRATDPAGTMEHLRRYPRIRCEVFFLLTDIDRSVQIYGNGKRDNNSS